MSWIYQMGLTKEEVLGVIPDDAKRAGVFAALAKLGLTIDLINPEEVIRATAPTLIGKQYKNPSIMRVDAPEAFSCSSFISYLYTLAGFWQPSISIDKYVFGTPITRTELRYGDLIFSNSGEIVATGIYYKSVEWKPGTEVPEGVDHVGMYLGDGKLIHASRSNGGVMIEDVDTAKNFGSKIVGYRRMGNLATPRYLAHVPDNFAPYQSKEAFLSLLESFAASNSGSLVRYEVPYYSQLTDIGGDFWPPRACGSTALAMAMAYFAVYNEGKSGLQSFCDLNRSKGAYVYPMGWFRGKLAEIARAAGLEAKVETGLDLSALAGRIENRNLALLSINKTILGRKRAHIVLCVGVVIGDGEPLGFLVHDPESTLPEFGAFQFVSREALAADWTNTATFISKDSAESDHGVCACDHHSESK